MRVVLHRVDRARALREGTPVVEIGPGLVAFVGFGRDDTPEVVRRLAGKIARIRIFEREGSRFGASVVDVGGEVLTLSQFTLMADTSRGARPNFSPAAPSAAAAELYDVLGKALRRAGVPGVRQGPFGSSLTVEITHRGPFTVVLSGGPG